MRAQVIGLEAVLADGTVLSRLDPPAKDNTGYDWPGLLCGSEGTLAVITRVRVRLVPPPGEQAVALVGVADTAAAIELVAAARRTLALSAVEIFYAEGLALVRAGGGLSAPFADEYPAYVVLEATGATDPTDDILALLSDSPVVGDATLASDGPGRARLGPTGKRIPRRSTPPAYR